MGTGKLGVNLGDSENLGEKPAWKTWGDGPEGREGREGRERWDGGEGEGREGRGETGRDKKPNWFGHRPAGAGTRWKFKSRWRSHLHIAM